jgi:hypothetical protein
MKPVQSDISDFGFEMQDSSNSKIPLPCPREQLSCYLKIERSGLLVLVEEVKHTPKIWSDDPSMSAPGTSMY